MTPPDPALRASETTPPDTYHCTCGGGEGHASTCDMWKQYKLDDERRRKPLPPADAPTAEELRDALDYATPFVSGQVTRTSSRVPTDPITARRTAVLRWLVSHLPAMLAARADNERLTRELADANERAIDYMNAALRASRSTEGGPNG